MDKAQREEKGYLYWLMRTPIHHTFGNAYFWKTHNIWDMMEGEYERQTGKNSTGVDKFLNKYMASGIFDREVLGG